MAIPSDFRPLGWEKIGKVAKHAKMTIFSDFKPLGWKKIGKVEKHAKLAIPSDFRSLWWEKIGKVAKYTKLVVLSHFRAFGGGVKDWKSCKTCEIGPFQVISNPLGGKRLEKL